MIISREAMAVAIIIGAVLMAGMFVLVLYLGRDTNERRWQRDRERWRK